MRGEPVLQLTIVGQAVKARLLHRPISPITAYEGPIPPRILPRNLDLICPPQDPAEALLATCPPPSLSSNGSETSRSARSACGVPIIS
jgi:hypothetical protein